MPTVDLVYDPECPNVRLARANLMRAFSAAGVPASWQEHRIGDPDAPLRTRGFGSPTILVDGRDVAQIERGAESCCRLYDGGSGAPSVDTIAAALSNAALTTSAASPPPSPASNRVRSSPLRSTIAALPGLAVAFMPKVVCPLCWPAYAGFLSATGLTFLMQDKWLFPISIVFLLLTLAALLWRASARHGYGPAMVGLLASVTILVGKFVFDSSVAVYGGIAILVAASVWNAWPRRAVKPHCSACTMQTEF